MAMVSDSESPKLNITKEIFSTVIKIFNEFSEFQ